MKGTLRRFTLRARLSALAAIAVGITVAATAAVAYFFVSSQLNNQVDTQIQTDIRIATSLGQNGLFDVRSASSVVARFRGDLLQVVGPDGLYYRPPGAFPSQARLPVTRTDEEVASVTLGRQTVSRTVSISGTTYRVETVGGLLQAQDGTPLALQVAHPINDMIHTLKELRFALFMLALGGIAVAVGLGYGVALATIRPVERLTAAAEHVAATEDLDAAIDDEGNDEVSRLAQAFNAMLAALRSSRQQQAQLVSDAGHELRTPLTSLRTNIEVLVKVPDLPSDDRSGLLADVQSQVEELTTLVGDLVELGRHDENESERTEVGLHLIVERALDRARRRDIGMRFIVELEAGSVLAQPVLLERAVLNVLDNAVKFSPPGGPIEVTLRRSDHWVLDIGDHGRGISPEDLPKVFDRFYRAAAARSLPGSGLGLAIVAQVITDIGGRLSALRRSEGGTLIRIELPIVAEIEPGKSE
jgi:two-component system sensor histidine kinase MprB